jgi:predicted N-formylglutamate amidohydrolase
MAPHTDIQHQINDAYEIYGTQQAPEIIFTCEHASNAVPFPISMSPKEKDILNDHWGWDIGISQLTKQLCHSLKSVSIHSRCSRLLCDHNRDITHPTLILKEADGAPLTFNHNLSETQVAERLDQYYHPYHQAVDDLIENHSPHPHASPVLISMHSFTPVWKHNLRTMDIGVLYDLESNDTALLFEEIKAQGFFVEKNEPYSGKQGMMYSAIRHGETNNIPYFELEINQFLLSTPQRIQKVSESLAPAFAKWLARK